MFHHPLSTVPTTSVPIKSKEEIEAWMEEFGKKTAAAFHASGVPIVDFRVRHHALQHAPFDLTTD